MFSNGWLDFFYAAHNELASTILNMTFSLTDGFFPHQPGPINPLGSIGKCGHPIRKRWEEIFFPNPLTTFVPHAQCPRPLENQDCSMKQKPQRISALILTALVTYGAPKQSPGACLAIFENQTEGLAVVKVLGTNKQEVALEAKRQQTLSLQPGDYYYKVRFELPTGPRYAIGPYFTMADASPATYTLTVTLGSPVLACLYKISKEEFESEVKDAALLSKAYRISENWLRWARIVLDVVPQSTEESLRASIKFIPQLTGKEVKGTDMSRIAIYKDPAGNNVSIRSVIQKHGEPTLRGTTKELDQRVDHKSKEEFEFDCYSFDGVIELQCRKGSDEVGYLIYPRIWDVEGIRTKAQRALDRAK
jgi:hypothetical protein